MERRPGSRSQSHSAAAATATTLTRSLTVHTCSFIRSLIRRGENSLIRLSVLVRSLLLPLLLRLPPLLLRLRPLFLLLLLRCRLSSRDLFYPCCSFRRIACRGSPDFTLWIASPDCSGMAKGTGRRKRRRPWRRHGSWHYCHQTLSPYPMVVTGRSVRPSVRQPLLDLSVIRRRPRPSFRRPNIDRYRRHADLGQAVGACVRAL